MKLGAAVAEGWREVLTAGPRVVFPVFALALLGGALGVSDALAVGAMIDRSRTYREAGAETVVLQAPGHVSGAMCDALSNVGGVRASGAVRASSQTLRAASLPDLMISYKESTSGFYSLLSVRTRGDAANLKGGLLLSEELAQELAVSAGDKFSTNLGAASVDAVYAYPTDGRLPDLQSAAVSSVDDHENFDQCWLESDFDIAVASAVVRLSVSPGGGDEVQADVRQLNARLGEDLDGATEFEGRVTRWNCVLAALGAALLGVIVVRSQRLRMASALQVGVPRPALAMQAMTEAGVVVVITLMLTLPAAVRVMALEASLAVLAPMVYGPILAASATYVLATVATTSLIRRTSLYNYFRDR